VAELVRARAQFNSELRSLREENLPQLSGDLEMESHRLQRLERVVDDLKADLNHRDQARATQITTLRKNIEKEFDQQGKIMSKHMTGFRASLVEFKDALAGVDTRVVTESTRAMTAETNMKNDFEAQQAALLVKLDSDTNMLKQYLETDVKTSIGSVAKTLQEVNVSLGTQLDKQGAEFKSQAALLSDLNTKVGTELAALTQQDEGIHQNLENLTKSMTQLRNGLDKVGAQLGSKVDVQAQTLEESSGQLKQLQGQYAALTKKLDADTKALRGYLDTDIRTSLQSMAKVVEAEKTRTTQSSKKLEDRIQKLESTTNADVKQAQAQVVAQDKHVKDLNQSVLSMREVLDSMAGMLGKRSDEQMKQIGKLTVQLGQMRQTQSTELSQQDTNLQTLSSHLHEITTSVQSVVTTLDQVSTSLSSRLDDQVARLAEQERRLTETANNSVSSQRLNQELFANVQQLNQLTTALGQLKDVVNNIGATLGEKVDEHEGQLAGLAQQVRQLQSSSSSSPQSSTPPQIGKALGPERK
jgi:DNA repair exonuclease SbcCD ATPase subunit